MAATFRTNDVQSNTYARFPVKVLPKVTTFTDADTTTAKVISISDTSVLGSRIDSIVITTDDASNNNMFFYLHDGTSLSTLPIAHVGVAGNSGTDGTTLSVSALRANTLEPLVMLDNNGNSYIMLGPGWTLYAAMGADVTASATVQVAVWGHDY